MGQYLVAHPDSLILHDTIEAAREHGNKFRETKPVKIYVVIEAEVWMPSGPPAPTPKPPGTPVEAARDVEPEAKAA